MLGSQDEGSAAATVGSGEEPLSPQVKVVIGVLLAAAFLMVLNETVMGVALPPLMVEFGVTEATAQWLTTSYMLTLATIIPVTGVILQRFSTRPLFITSLTLFLVGTVTATVAPAFGVLVVARVVQAAGAAMMLPLLMTTVMTFVPVARRGRMMGLISVVISVAPAVGPTFAGFMMHLMNWRWIFGVVAPIALICLLLGARLVTNITTPRLIRVDVVSVILSTLTFGGLIYGLSSIGESAQGNALIAPWIPLTVGVMALGVFVWRQRVLQRIDGALLDLRVFTFRPFLVGLAMIMVAMAGLFGSLILLPIYLQKVMLHDALVTGLILLPGGLLMGLIAPGVGRLYDRVGPRPLVIPGGVLLAVGMASLYFVLTPTTATPLVVVMVCVIMGSLGLLMTPLMTSAMGSLTSGLYSHGSAIINTMQQLAGAAGTALCITAMTVGRAAWLETGATAAEATAHGFNQGFLAGGVLALICAAMSFFVRRPTEPVS